MPPASLFDRAASLLGNFGGQVAISIAASAVAAAFLTLPESLVGVAPAAVEPVASVTSPEPEAIAGKYRQRHHDAVGAAPSLAGSSPAGLVTASAVIMPMSLDWGLPAMAADAPVRSEIAAAAPAPAEPLPARRASLPPERPKRVALAAAPPAREAANPAETKPATVTETVRPPATLLGRVVTGPIARVGGAAATVMGAVGAAGSWTVSQATGLLPRW